MRRDYTEKIRATETELAAVEHEIDTCTDPLQLGPLLALKGSLQHSLQWYRNRMRTPVTTLGVGVGDDIHTAEAH